MLNPDRKETESRDRKVRHYQFPLDMKVDSVATSLSPGTEVFVTLKTHKYDGRAVVVESSDETSISEGRVPVEWVNLGQTPVERSFKSKMLTANPKRIKTLRLRKDG